MSKMIQVWTNSLVGRALSHVAADLYRADPAGSCERTHAFADLHRQDESHARARIRERLGIVVAIPEELAQFATPVTEPAVSRAPSLVSPTDDMLVAGAEALPTSIDNDEAMRLAADVFLAMMSRMPSNRYVDPDRHLARHAG